MSRTEAERLHDAERHFETALRYAEDGGLDEKTLDAICMRIAAGIEALHALPLERRDELFGDLWPAMWGMRNRIAHTYSRVEVGIVVATVRVDLPEILRRIQVSREDGGPPARH